MEEGMYRYRFSKHFNRLTLLGAWTAEWITNPIIKKLYFIHCHFWHILIFSAMIAQVTDLYLVWGNLEKVIFNLSTSTIVIGYSCIVLMSYVKKKELNGLRVALWKDSLELVTEEDTELLDDAFKQLTQIGLGLYTAYYIFLPCIMVFSYFSYLWGPRRLPFAAHLPFLKEPMDDKHFVPSVLYEGLCAFYIVILVIEGELSHFSLLLQIEAFLKILMKNIMKLNEIYADEGDVHEGVKSCLRREVNIYLKQERAKRLIRDLVQHHLKIIGYVNSFESIFNEIFIIETFGAATLTIVQSIGTLLYLNVSLQNSFQMALVIAIMVDVLFLCYHTSKVMTQCADVGYTVYSTCWYKMDADIRKKLSIIMVCCKRTPKITAGKFFLVNQEMYLSFIKGIYSCMMLMRQVIVK